MAKEINLKDTNNIAVVLHKIEDLRIGQWPIPKKLLPNECLVKTNSVGICGTDMHLWVDGYMSDYILKKPMPIGHEVSGTVIEVGSTVTKLKPGDRVTVEPAVVCFHCHFCKQAKYNLCGNTDPHGLPHDLLPHDGFLQQYFTHPAVFLHKLPDNVSWIEGAMCEPLSVVVHAVRRANVTVGQNVLVCGAGTMGLMSMLCAKAFGAHKLAITDVDPEKLKLAKQLGADFTYLIDPKNFDYKELANKIRNDMETPPEVTFECTGNGPSTNLAIFTTRHGGKIALVGLGALQETASIVTATIREIDLIGVCRYNDEFPLAIHLLETGKVNLKPLCTKTWKIHDALEAFKAMRSGNSGTIKTMIQFE